jgi:hypothetical protein
MDVPDFISNIGDGMYTNSIQPESSGHSQPSINPIIQIRSLTMGSRIIRNIAYVAATAFLLVIAVALIANLNVQLVHAGGSPQPLYQLISQKITANATFTIYTTTIIKGTGTNAYTVHSQSTGSGYYVAVLGTDYLCIQSATGAAGHPLCLPYSAIAGLTY